jgi:hypothetical protein
MEGLLMRLSNPLPVAAVMLALLSAPAAGRAQPAAPQVPSVTVLLAGTATTWLNPNEPPYKVGITVKTKLERVGFRVVMDQATPHDYVLVLTYEETQGRQYPRLEYGTNIRCDMTLWRPGAGAPERLWSRRLETGTSWPTPVGSLYWEAVQNLEENPYYYYIGELVQGMVSTGEDEGAVFARVLRQKKLGSSTYESGGLQASGHVVANAEARLNAIRELGRLKDRRALPTLWDLAGARDEHDTAQRDTAIRAIGEIGDPESLDRLSALYNAETDDGLRIVLDKAMARIREQRKE